MFFDPQYMFFVMLPGALITMFAQWRVKSAYSRWSKMPNERGLTGLDVAQELMRHRGLENVKIERIAGHLTDHYDPRSKTMRLSQGSMDEPSVAAMAIVAHELGHAEQHKTGNLMLNMRGALVPAANIGSSLGVWIIIAGLFMGAGDGMGLGSIIAWAGVGLFGMAVAFTLITLPVEFDASRRAKVWLRETGLASPKEQRGVDKVLDAAALTYVAAAAASILQMMYWVSRISGRD